MPFIKNIDVENGKILLWEITESLDTLCKMLPEAYSDPMFQKITNPKRKKEWLATRLLLLKENCSPDQISYNENGQPQINKHQYCKLSISHSDKLAGVFLHKSKNIGLDIESINRDYIRIAKKYLSPTEIELAQNTNYGHGLFWCMKEAGYKAAGIQGIHFAEQIFITQSEHDIFNVQIDVAHKPIFNVNYIRLGTQLIVFLIEEKEFDR